MEFSSWLKDPARDALVMGVLNVTPDSFSDGGQFQHVDDAIARGVAMIGAGADLIDIGGESTRPGSLPVDADEQIRRIVPVIRGLRALETGSSTVISVDTAQAKVASAALDAGAEMVNDISAGRDDPALLPLVRDRHVPIILMHMQGAPRDMQINPTYSDVVGEVSAFLRERARVAESIGIDSADILLDPGIGFGKTVEHNLELLRHMPKLAAMGRPLVVGTSRKSFIAKITGETVPSDRLFGTAATVAWSVIHGAGIVRVHDVEPMSRVVRMIQAIQEAE